ncbi:uncharacterized protein ACO6RY_03197 [Pungitius sinensis]
MTTVVPTVTSPANVTNSTVMMTTNITRVTNTTSHAITFHQSLTQAVLMTVGVLSLATV